MKFKHDADILREKFIQLFKLRANKILDTLSSHINNRVFFTKAHKEIKSATTLNMIIYVITGLLRMLKQYYPYNQIPDWTDKPVILVDIDNTLFEKTGDPCSDGHCFGDPVFHVVEVVNELYHKGCTIKIFTGRLNQYVLNIDRRVKPALEKALKRAGIKYHKILEIQKPNAEVILDDLAINPLI